MSMLSMPPKPRRDSCSATLDGQPRRSDHFPSHQSSLAVVAPKACSTTAFTAVGLTYSVMRAMPMMLPELYESSTSAVPEV